MLKIASWNVNSLKVRLEQVLEWLETTQMDVLALQETKVIDEEFPKETFEQKGYHLVYSGQKTYNGVAVISKSPITEVLTDIKGFEDLQRRILAVTVAGVRVVNLYVPNGAAVDSDKYSYKLNWMEQVRAFLQEQHLLYPNMVVLGDFNIAPEDRDVYDPKAWEGQILVSPLERQAFARFLELGFCDSFRLFEQEEKSYSWWDYRAAAFRRNMGLRIDHVLLSKALQSTCKSAAIDKEPRKSERPSDHAPVWVELEGCKTQ